MTLDFSPELETQIEQAALASGIEARAFVMEATRRALDPDAALDALRGGLAKDVAPARRGVSRLKGRYPSTRTVADFMADRSSEEGEEAPQSEA